MAQPSSFNLTDADVSRLFKIRYDKKSNILWNFKRALLGLMKQTQEGDGKQVNFPVEFGIFGGIGTGTIPDFNRLPVQEVSFTTKKVYSVAEIDRRTLKQGTSKNSYINGLSEMIQKTVESFSWNMERMLFGTGTGALGTIASAGVTDVGGGVFDVVISTATYNLANWEVNNIVNVETGNTDKFVITAITPSTRTIRLQRISGSQVPAATDVIYMQGSENNDIYGFDYATDNSGTKWNITSQYRWQSTNLDLSASTPSIDGDIIDQASTDFETNRGESLTHLFMHYEQLRRLKATVESQKRYSLTPMRVEAKGDMTGKISWKAMEFFTSEGPIPIIASRFCPKDRVYGVYMPDLKIVHAPGGPQWVDEDGSVWKPIQRPYDGFYAVYATYCQSYLPPPSVMVIKGLAIT